MGEWLIAVSAASVLMSVLDDMAGSSPAGKTASFVMGVIYMTVILQATCAWLGG